MCSQDKKHFIELGHLQSYLVLQLFQAQKLFSNFVKQQEQFMVIQGHYIVLYIGSKMTGETHNKEVVYLLL